MSREEIIDTIRSGYESFPNLQQIVFSGGECLTIGDDLFDAISYATSLGLLTRIVTNGYWGASKKKSAQTALRLRESGLTEINISTGRDHAKFVKIEAVLTAMSDTVGHGIFGCLTVEQDAEDSDVLREVKNDPRFSSLIGLGDSRFRFQVNTWMKFNDQHKARAVSPGTKANSPCSQLFSNIVVTPHKNISACCGLTYEHIPELRIGNLENEGLAAAYEAARNDFVKIWIHMDGADGVIRKVYDGKPPADLISQDHMCDTCARLHKCDTTRALVRERYQEFYPDVMFRYQLKTLLNRVTHTTLASTGE